MQDVSTGFTASDIADLRTAFEKFGVEVTNQRNGNLTVYATGDKPQDGRTVDNPSDAQQVALDLLAERYKRSDDGRFLLCQYKDVSSPWNICLLLDPDQSRCFFVEHRRGPDAKSLALVPEGYDRSLNAALSYFIRYVQRCNATSLRPTEYHRVKL